MSTDNPLERLFALRGSEPGFWRVDLSVEADHPYYVKLQWFPPKTIDYIEVLAHGHTAEEAAAKALVEFDRKARFLRSAKK